MSSQADEAEIERALTALVMNCQELLDLEGQLSQFNIFRVLRADRHEIRHSNMLAWLMAPDESHGLGDRFLRRWLMRVVHDTGIGDISPHECPSPIEIDALDIDYVEVERESNNIDVVVLIHALPKQLWVICMENKVEASQRQGQLPEYRAVIERRFPEAVRRLYVFLTQYSEAPEDPVFIPTTYKEVEQVLRACIKERSTAVGAEPLLLLNHYLSLLSEDFVDDNRSTQLAKQIYQSHRKALDFIFDNRVDAIRLGSDAIEAIIQQNAIELGIIPFAVQKGWVRFLPKEWSIPANQGGTGWGSSSPFVLCEICFWTKQVELQITVGAAPDEWVDRIWERAASHPFKQEYKKRARKYVKPYKSRSKIPVINMIEEDPDELRARLHEWLKEELAKPSFREAVDVMRKFLDQLQGN